MYTPSPRFPKRRRLLGRFGHEEDPYERYYSTRLQGTSKFDIDLKEFFDRSVTNKKYKGLRTPENKRWSLHSSDFWFAFVHTNFTSMVGRSMLLELANYSVKLPPTKDPLDLAESEGLPDYPIDKETLHNVPEHFMGNCYWPHRDRATVSILDRAISKDIHIDILLVHDPDNVTRLRSPSDDYYPGKESTPSPPRDAFSDINIPEEEFIRFVPVDAERIGIPWVPLSPEPIKPMIAFLFLERNMQLGSGHSAVVYDARLKLPFDINFRLFEFCYAHTPDTKPGERILIESAKWPTQVLVAAKIPNDHPRGFAFCNDEAKAYASFPDYLSQDWSGYQVIHPVKVPQQACAVVPKSYGYFVPDVTYFKLSDGTSMHPDKGKKESTPILLTEQCGKPLRPHHINRYLKDRLYSMVIRLHDAGFIQRSIAPRNFLIQPGPLHFPPEKRSYETPSFRLIDFGRARNSNDPKQKQEFLDNVKQEQVEMMMMLDYHYDHPYVPSPVLADDEEDEE